MVVIEANASMNSDGIELVVLLLVTSHLIHITVAGACGSSWLICEAILDRPI